MNDNDNAAPEIKSLIRSPSPKFKARLHRSIERRVLTRDLSVMFWEVPRLALSETLFICASWLSGHKRRNGGRS